MKKAKLAVKASFHGRTSKFNFDAPHSQCYGGKNLYMSGCKTGDGGPYGKKLDSPPSSKTRKI